MSQLDTYRATALSKFNHLTGNMDANGHTTTSIYPNQYSSTSNNYWRIGNVFDSLTDYIYQDAKLPSPNVNAAQVSSFMQNTLNLYRELIIGKSNGCWYDDFAWWGIASSKAFDSKYDFIFGNLKNEFQQIALSTWDIMNNGKYDDVHYGAPNAWKTCNQTVFASCAPRFSGGAWQYDMFADHRPSDLERSPSNPSTPIAEGGYQAAGLGPFQDTVVNGLYFVLANRMKAAGWGSQTSIDSIYGFIHTWFFDSSLDASTYLYQSVTGGKLVRERVSTYANGSSVHGFKETLSWTGDQGLLIGALCEYNRVSPQAWIEPMVTDIMGGIAGSVLESAGSDTYIMPWFPLTANHLHKIDAGDYSSGLGVFLRYLDEAYGFDSTVQTQLNNANNPLRKLILETADTVVAGQLPQWADGGMFDDFNQLVSLQMAISILK